MYFTSTTICFILPAVFLCVCVCVLAHNLLTIRISIHIMYLLFLLSKFFFLLVSSVLMYLFAYFLLDMLTIYVLHFPYLCRLFHHYLDALCCLYCSFTVVHFCDFISASFYLCSGVNFLFILVLG